MAGAALFRPPPSLGSPVVGAGSITRRNSQSIRRRPPFIVSLSQTHNHHQDNKAPRFSSLRAEHTPAPTPVLGGFLSSTTSAWTGQKKKNNARDILVVTRAQLTGGFMDIIALAQDAFRGSSFGGQKSIITRASFDRLVEQVMDVVALVQYEIQRLGYLTFGSRDYMLSMALTIFHSGVWIGTLKRCGTDLTKLAKEGKLDPVLGKQDQIEQVVQILSRRSKNNPCLIGDPGVGKTAIVEGLAAHCQWQCSANTQRETVVKVQLANVIVIDMVGLLAGTVYCGQFETRIKNLLREVKRSGNVILFIDEVHTIVGAGQLTGNAIDVANIFKPALARGELQCIGATTTDEYKKHVEKDPALERRFRPVKIPEPTVEETTGILKGLRERYEKHNKVQYSDDSLHKAIDLIDQAGSLVSLRHAQQKPPMNVEDLEAELNRVIKEKGDAVRWENYKRAKELRDRELDLKSLIDKSKEMKNSDEVKSSAVPVVTEEDIRHIVSTWTGVPVQKLYTDETNKLLKMEETLHQRVVGQDAAVTAISRAIRRARAGLNDQCRPIGSFIFAGPTGVGKTELAKALAAFYYGSEDAMVRIKDLVGEEMKRHFRPEFLNRLDEVIVFKQLTKVEVREIASLMLNHVADRVGKKGIELQATEGFKELVVEEGFDPSYGVRSLKRAILRLLEDALADKMLTEDIKVGDSVTVDVDSAGNVRMIGEEKMSDRAPHPAALASAATAPTPPSPAATPAPATTQSSPEIPQPDSPSGRFTTPSSSPPQSPRDHHDDVVSSPEKLDWGSIDEEDGAFGLCASNAPAGLGATWRRRVTSPWPRQGGRPSGRSGEPMRINAPASFGAAGGRRVASP
ncbi:hypothetical protein EJB05_10269, partial [Eragrostis curvula]